MTSRRSGQDLREVVGSFESFKPALGDFALLDSDQPLLAKLKPDSKRVVDLYAAGDNYEKIAEAIGRPVGTVKSRLHRARARIIQLRKVAAAEASA